jgi:chromatin structure-remodeling complex subunit RSC1/2
LKRKRYRTIDDFMRDVDLMFENAKLFNEDDSQIHLDAIELQKEAHRLADIEKGKSDTEYVLEEGRKPRPEGIEHNGELWKVGDWVHINNANDTAKPIVAQIFRTYEDSEGQEWVNACWYYRPEQTVHHFEKNFYPMEVVKTGQYRDHPIDHVIDRCFVMFFTRFSKGRPRALAPGAKVYVCEARYNEEKHKINKIKTWASCLPDEIRDQDYEMDMFADGPRPNKKVPSPLLYMVEQGNVTEEVPQPKWGEENVSYYTFDNCQRLIFIPANTSCRAHTLATTPRRVSASPSTGNQPGRLMGQSERALQKDQ